MRRIKLFLILSLIISLTSNVLGFSEPDFDRYSEATVIYNIDYDQIIYDDHGSEILMPASITKVMTAIVVMKNTINFDEEVEISEDMLAGLRESNASVLGLQVGEIVTVRDLLYGLLLPSGGDCAQALAIYNSTQIDAFVNEMNRVARNLGCLDTQFMNPTGLDEDGITTTARDLVLIMREAIKYDIFKEIIAANYYEIPPTNKNPKGYKMQTSVLIKDESKDYYSPYVIGGKTGFTYAAQRTLVTYGMTSNGLSYIVVTLKAPFEGYYTDSKCFIDQKLIYEWLDKNFKKQMINKEGDYFDTYPILHSKIKKFDTSFMDDVSIIMDSTIDPSKVYYEPHVLKTYEATILKDQYIGYAIVKYNGQMIGKVELKSDIDVHKNTFVMICEKYWGLLKVYYPFVIGAILLLILLGFLIDLRSKENKRKAQQLYATKRRLKELQAIKELNEIEKAKQNQ